MSPKVMASFSAFGGDLPSIAFIVLHSLEGHDIIDPYRYFHSSLMIFFSNYVLNFLDQHAILYDHQFGFRRGHSTSHAIISLVEKISRSLDTGEIVVGGFLDFKKAFDTVDHQILLDKLYAHGLKNNIYEWFKSYLANRSQYVMYNNSKSETKHITHGVPQGSILGPLLFILYMNDFSRASDLLFSILFADDTSVFSEGQSYTGVIETLNKELKNIVSWLNSNKLTLNIKKTHYTIFHRSRIIIKKLKITLHNQTIFETNSLKFLGVIINNNFKWHAHIGYIKNKISKSIGIIYKARKYINKQNLINLYYSFIFPYLIYCNEIWGNACQTYLDPLIKFFKKRIMT